MRCVKTQFKRTVLCAGTMVDYIEILNREQQGTTIGGESESKQGFTAVDDFAGYLEASKPTRRFDGVSMSDQSSPSYTHAGYIPYDQDIYELDVNTLFVRITRDKPRLFKLKAIENYDEQDMYLMLQLSETGFEEKEATGV